MKLLDLINLKRSEVSMKYKYSIKRSLKSSRKNYDNCKSQKKLLRKVYLYFIFHCIILNADNFYLIFKGKYINSLWTRLLDWLKYWGEIIYGHYLRFNSPKHPTAYHSRLIYGCARKPVHEKFQTVPNKDILKQLLSFNHLEIIDEFSDEENTFYHISIKV